MSVQMAWIRFWWSDICVSLSRYYSSTAAWNGFQAVSSDNESHPQAKQPTARLCQKFRRAILTVQIHRTWKTRHASTKRHHVVDAKLRCWQNDYLLVPINVFTGIKERRPIDRRVVIYQCTTTSASSKAFQAWRLRHWWPKLWYASRGSTASIRASISKLESFVHVIQWFSPFPWKFADLRQWMAYSPPARTGYLVQHSVRCQVCEAYFRHTKQ